MNYPLCDKQLSIYLLMARNRIFDVYEFFAAQNKVTLFLGRLHFRNECNINAAEYSLIYF